MLWIVGIVLQYFYQSPNLSLYFIGISVALVFYSLTIVPSAILHRNLELKKIAIVNLFSTIISGLSAVICAINNLKVWSLIFQTISMNISLVVGYVILSKWRFQKFVNFRSVRKLWEYGSNLFYSGMLETVFTKIDSFIIGKIFPIEILGFFYRAQSFDYFIRNISSGTLTNVALPIISRSCSEKRTEIFFNYFNFSIFISFYISGLLFIVSHDVIKILFGEEWDISARFFQLMTIGSFVYPLSALMVTSIAGVGHSKRYFKLEIIKKVLMLITYPALFLGGVETYLYSILVFYLIALLINAYYVSRSLSVSFPIIIKLIFLFIMITCFVVFITYCAMQSIHNKYLHFTLSFLIYTLLYFFTCSILKVEAFYLVLNKIMVLYDICYKNLFTRFR